MTQPPDKQFQPLSIDWMAYGEMLEDCDLSDDQKRELIETLWSIVVSCVDLNFSVGSACEQNAQNTLSIQPDMLYSAMDNPKSNKHQLADDLAPRQRTKEES